MERGVRLLIATPAAPSALQGAVVLVAVHGDEGALGFIVNRPFESPEQIEREFEIPPLDDPRAIRRGGPANAEMAWVLFDADAVARLPDDHALLSGRLGISASAEAVHQLHEEALDAPRMVLLVGHLRWEADQLEEELADGVWLSTPVDPSLVFDAVSSECWTLATCSALGMPRPWYGAPTFADA